MKKQSYPSSFSAIIFLLLAMIWFVPAVAQEDSPGSRPALGGHSFTESVDVPSPFVRSYIRNRLGGGKSFDVSTPTYEVGGHPVGGFEGNILFAILDFEYQYAIKPWIAIRARVFGGGRLGSDTLALLSDGVTMSTGFEFGWLIRLKEWDRTALSMDLNLADRSYTGINIARFVEDIISEEPASLVRKTPSARSGVGLRFAWAVSPLLGVSATGGGGYGESIDRNRGEVWFGRISAAMDFDLRTKTSLPMGIALGYSYDSFPEMGDDIAEGVHASFVRFSYLGREDFLVSLDISGDRIPVSGDRPDVNAVSVTISLRYYI